MKTTIQALRTRGKGKDKYPHHYEWDVGEKSGNLDGQDLFFAFVDLKGVKDEMPDVFTVPSKVIFRAFDKPYFKSGIKRRWRWHPEIETVSQLKNNWRILRDYLRTKAKL